jgi:hypothetical protein
MLQEKCFQSDFLKERLVFVSDVFDPVKECKCQWLMHCVDPSKEVIPACGQH